MRLVVAVASAMLCAPWLHGGGVAHAATPESAQFDVLPAAGSATDERGSYFEIDAPAGAVVEQQITITNRERRPLTLQLSGVSTSTGPLGGVTYAVAGQGERAVHVDWLKLDRSRVQVASGATETVSFRVQQPRDAAPGDHLAGISIEAVTPRPKGTRAAATAGASAGVVVRSRRVIAVQARVDGPRQAKLEITGVTASPRADGMYLMVELGNVGNTLLKGGGEISVDADQAPRPSFAVDTFVPGTTIEYPIRWTERPTKGEFQTTVDIDYGDGIAHWDGTVRVGDREMRGLEDRSGTSSARVAPWMLTGGGAGVAVLAVLAIAWWRRRSYATA